MQLSLSISTKISGNIFKILRHVIGLGYRTVMYRMFTVENEFFITMSSLNNMTVKTVARSDCLV